MDWCQSERNYQGTKYDPLDPMKFLIAIGWPSQLLVVRLGAAKIKKILTKDELAEC